MKQNLLIKNLLVFYLYLCIGTPIAFLLIGLPMILHLQGFSPSAIGLFSLASIPYITAFLFSPIFDGFVFEKNHYKKWIGIFSVIYVGLLFAISCFSLKEDYYILFSLILLIVFVSTFLATPLNALCTKIFTREEQSSVGGFKSSAYFTSSILGNGLVLLLYNNYGWRFAILSIVFLILPSFIVLHYIKEQKSDVEKQTIPFKQIINFFRQEDILVWIVILATYLMFVSPIWIFLKPYLLLHGFSPDNVALLAGLIGSSVAAAGSLGVPFFARNMDKKQLLLGFALLNTLTVSLFLLFEFMTLHFMLINIVFIALSIGLSNSILFAMIMDNCRKEYKAIDYSVQLSVDATGRIFAGMVAGLLIEMFSYIGLFVVCLMGILVVLLMVFRYLKRNS